MFPAVATMEADDLAKLALKAATQLDRMERNRPADVSAIKNFVEALVTISSAEPHYVGVNLSLGPIGSEMLSGAVLQATDHRVTSFHALTSELQKIADEMRLSIEAGGKRDAIKPLKSFSLFIHDFVHRNKMSQGLNERGVFDYDHSYSGARAF